MIIVVVWLAHGEVHSFRVAVKSFAPHVENGKGVWCSDKEGASESIKFV